MQSATCKVQNAKLNQDAASSAPPDYCLRSTVYSRAFSLAELMIAIGILGIGMLIIASAFPVALDQTRQALELSTSQRVFDEAVNTLKTKVNWVQLETYLAQPASNQYIGQDFSGRNLWKIDFNYLIPTTTNRLFSNFTQNPVPGTTHSDSTYSVDTTYGWVTSVQKIGNQCYKFWIFVLREPTGIEDGANFKFVLNRINVGISVNPPTVIGTTVPATKILRFTLPTIPPYRETSFLANNGNLYKILDTGAPTTTTQDVICDREVSDGISDLITGGFPNPANTMMEVNTIAYPARANTTYQVTRKNPVVAVFQTVISY
jgi:prepilin-type N-terminal cleavage/methylation domain-containing protein